MTISSVSPTPGWPFYYTQVVGSGFQTGARVMFGGLDAGHVQVSDGKIVTSPPWRDSGSVDVVVTNPDGSSASLAGGFTYRQATLWLNRTDVAAGETLVVTWSGPHDPSDFAPPDVIGLYAIDDPSNTALWWTQSGVGDRFSAQFNAPIRPGAYELRYHMLSKYLLAKTPLIVR